MATNKSAKVPAVTLAEQLIQGTNKHLANVTQIMLTGGTYTPAQVTAQLQALITLRRDVDAARATTKAKLALERADTPQLRAFMSAYVAFVKAAFGSAPDVLADFGVHSKARTPLTVEAKAAAAAKRASTRAARHTMGTKQKKQVKGTVTGVVVTPVTSAHPAEASPASPNVPAPNAGTPPGTTPHTAT